MPAPFSALIPFFDTPDLLTSHHFYHELLGLPLALDQGACRIYRVAGGAYIGFCQRDAAKPEGVIVTLVTADVDGWHVQLAAAGVVIETPPRYNERYQIYQCFARDPHGYLIEIQEFRDPRWQPEG